MTTKLFYENMYRAEADAKVVAIEKNNLVLDQTIFFPEGGGQVGDTGLIDNIKVVDTQKKISRKSKTLFHNDFPVILINSDVVHILDSEPDSINEGRVVHLTLDWDRRYRIMRMHSAAHIAYHYVFQIFGEMAVKGCRIAFESSRFDFSLPKRAKLQSDLLSEVESLSNEFINKAYDISNIPLDNEPEALYWVCGGIKIPCGGMHVKNTSEIGRVLIKRRSQGKKSDRMYIYLVDE